MEVRIRLGSAIAAFAPAPVLTVSLSDGATVADLYGCLAGEHPELSPALRSALPIIAGAHVGHQHRLAPGEEVALLAPAAGG